MSMPDPASVATMVKFLRVELPPDWVEKSSKDAGYCYLCLYKPSKRQQAAFLIGAYPTWGQVKRLGGFDVTGPMHAFQVRSGLWHIGGGGAGVLAKHLSIPDDAYIGSCVDRSVWSLIIAMVGMMLFGIVLDSVLYGGLGGVLTLFVQGQIVWHYADRPVPEGGSTQFESVVDSPNPSSDGVGDDCGERGAVDSPPAILSREQEKKKKVVSLSPSKWSLALGLVVVSSFIAGLFPMVVADEVADPFDLGQVRVQIMRALGKDAPADVFPAGFGAIHDDYLIHYNPELVGPRFCFDSPEGRYRLVTSKIDAAVLRSYIRHMCPGTPAEGSNVWWEQGVRVAFSDHRKGQVMMNREVGVGSSGFVAVGQTTDMVVKRVGTEANKLLWTLGETIGNLLNGVADSAAAVQGDPRDFIVRTVVDLSAGVKTHVPHPATLIVGVLENFRAVGNATLKFASTFATVLPESDVAANWIVETIESVHDEVKARAETVATAATTVEVDAVSVINEVYSSSKKVVKASYNQTYQAEDLAVVLTGKVKTLGDTGERVFWWTFDVISNFTLTLKEFDYSKAAINAVTYMPWVTEQLGRAAAGPIKGFTDAINVDIGATILNPTPQRIGDLRRALVGDWTVVFDAIGKMRAYARIGILTGDWSFGPSEMYLWTYLLFGPLTVVSLAVLGYSFRGRVP